MKKLRISRPQGRFNRSLQHIVDRISGVQANSIASAIKNKSVPPAARNELKGIPVAQSSESRSIGGDAASRKNF